MIDAKRTFLFCQAPSKTHVSSQCPIVKHHRENILLVRTKSYEIAVKMCLYDRRQDQRPAYNQQRNAIDERTEENDNVPGESHENMDNTPKNG